MCQRTLTHPEAVDRLFLPNQKKRKDTSELVFTRSRDIDFRFIK